MSSSGARPRNETDKIAGFPLPPTGGILRRLRQLWLRLWPKVAESAFEFLGDSFVSIETETNVAVFLMSFWNDNGGMGVQCTKR